jgi:2,5-dioxopentanoate dehydrogenase
MPETAGAQLTGQLLIGGLGVTGHDGVIHGLDPATGTRLEPAYGYGGPAEVARAAELAQLAFPSYRATTAEQRARFLETLAANIASRREALVERAVLETGLPAARISGEVDRTTGQLALFAEVLREGSWQCARIDRPDPDRQPAPRPDIRQRAVPLGPVAVFAASNFPLAFSVAGGDTASALAAGCPVVVKAHDAHPGTAEIVGQAVSEAVRAHDLHPGVFSLLYGTGEGLGVQLVSDPRIKAVGFTGSRHAGLALVDAAARRPVPIPVYAEMSSVNPVFLLPSALRSRTEHIAQGFLGSLTLGSGQFCTNPGLVVAIDGPELDRFAELVSHQLAERPATPMLTPHIAASYRAGLDRATAVDGVQVLARGRAADSELYCRAALLRTEARTFLAAAGLQDEVFGASSLIIGCADAEELAAVAAALEGQLTATIHAADDDATLAGTLLPTLELGAGRIVFNGWPTGVEVGHAMVHGGPFPATSDSRTTSVGSRAIERFLRPVAYQDVPAALMPAAVADANPDHIWRRVDGRLTQD